MSGLFDRRGWPLRVGEAVTLLLPARPRFAERPVDERIFRAVDGPLASQSIVVTESLSLDDGTEVTLEVFTKNVEIVVHGKDGDRRSLPPSDRWFVGRVAGDSSSFVVFARGASLRGGRASLADGYVAVERREAWLWNVHVPPYTAGSWNNPDPKRKRKLLLHRREIDRLAGKIQRSGATCIPLSIYFRGSRAKVQIALVTGKKLRDKRETIRRREADRETRAAIKAARRR